MDIKKDQKEKSRDKGKFEGSIKIPPLSMGILKTDRGYCFVFEKQYLKDNEYVSTNWLYPEDIYRLKMICEKLIEQYKIKMPTMSAEFYPMEQ